MSLRCHFGHHSWHRVQYEEPPEVSGSRWAKIYTKRTCRRCAREEWQSAWHHGTWRTLEDAMSEGQLKAWELDRVLSLTPEMIRAQETAP